MEEGIPWSRGYADLQTRENHVFPASLAGIPFKSWHKPRELTAEQKAALEKRLFGEAPFEDA